METGLRTDGAVVPDRRPGFRILKSYADGEPEMKEFFLNARSPGLPPVLH